MNEKEKLQEIIRLGTEVTEIKDLDLLMHRILTLVRQFSNADAGSIYIRDGDHLEFNYTQNGTLQKKLPPGKKMIYSRFLIPIGKNTIAGYVAETGEILNIPDVYSLPSDTPYRFARSFDSISNYRTRSMLTLPLRTNQGSTIGVLQIINAMNDQGDIVPFPDEEIPMIMYFANSAAISLERAQMTRAIILRMIGMAELRDPKETGAHVNRVAAYATELYEAWGRANHIPEDEIRKTIDVLRMAAMLHDVGKVGISDLILKKPARYTEDEYEVMKKHTIIGAGLFNDSKSELDDAAAQVALNHHERWDGLGYPGHVDPITGLPLPGHMDGTGKPLAKKGLEIPIFGRVVAVADVYDALSSRRSYKQAWEEDEILENLRSQAGKHFDPDLIHIFMSIHDVILAIKRRYPDQE